MNVLIIKPGAIGDLLQMTPVFRALKTKFPDCRITLMVGSAATASLFRHHWSVDSIVVFDRKGAHHGLRPFLSLRRDMGAGNFDLVLNFQRSNLKAWLLATAAFPCRVLVYHKARKRVVHAVVNHLETLAPLGISTEDTILEMYPGPSAEEYAEQLFMKNGWRDQPVVALNPGASHAVNRWPTSRFSELADRLFQKLGAVVLLVGGREDRGLAEEIAAKADAPPVLLTGATDLQQLAAVLKRCSILVSGDTGPMHMATAVGTPVVALFGAADPARTGPVGDGNVVIQSRVQCVPCRSRRCRNEHYLECMDQIDVEQVFDAVVSVLSK